MDKEIIEFWNERGLHTKKYDGKEFLHRYGNPILYLQEKSNIKNF
jgi:hypothetical protein